MTVSEGTKLGPYEIVAPLGAGGMGEVWRAKDARLDREVAIKILPAGFSADPQLRARFDREAKTISQLNHPNVCSLFDVGHQDGIDFLVMELLDGESLADRLARGALPVDLVLRYGTEIASALGAAHRQGIIHRDLKPGNVMLTRSGAKLLDFGLAKSGPLLVSMPGTSRIADSPTEHRPLTEQGTLIGTFQYMAPEQLEGQEADARTDIFAFGAVLYEMATGRRAFHGKNKTSLIASIVSGTPVPVSEVAPLTPPALNHIIRKCLEKDPDDRWQSIHDVADQLRWIAEAGSRAGEPAPVLARRRTKLRMAWLLHAATAILAVAATLGVLRAMKERPRIIRSSIIAPEGTRFDNSSGPLALSPDGRRAAFVATSEGGKSMLWVRSLDALTAQPLAGTEDAAFPFWSPDSRFIGFFASGKLRRIDANGGPPQTIADAAGGGGGRGGTWNRNGIIVFTPGTGDPIYRVPAAGGKPVAVTTLDTGRGETSHRFPEFLSDGEHFLYFVEARAHPGTASFDHAIRLASIGSNRGAEVLRAHSPVRHTKGHLLFVRDKTLLAQPFDEDDLALRGEAVPVAENVVGSTRYVAMFSVSDNGLLAIQSGTAGEVSTLVWMDRDGRDIETVGKPADYRQIALSHDEKRVAATIVDAKSNTTDIWVLDIDRGTATRLTFDPQDDFVPIWSVDDRRVYFTSARQGRGDVFWKSSSGTGVEHILVADPEWTMLTSISADGKLGAMTTNNIGKKTAWDIWLHDFATGKGRVLLETPFAENAPQLSRDGRWVAYHSSESGRNEVFVLSLEDDGGKWQISTDGGTRPLWSRGDKEIIFLGADGKMMVVDVARSPRFTASVPRVLIEPRLRPLPGILWAISSDGQRILVNRDIEDRAAAPYSLIQNWTEGLAN
ncbi:MAG TPA: protein kinase [Thermoanaerobaculia bacterium]|nr:protein kinase [Thermoanaerobaculia bacterium]